jgi:hypothetical protein
MTEDFVKAKAVSLRDDGKDEKWLQRKIEEDPSILGLGDLTLIQSERMQPARGRIDLLLEDKQEGIRYEVEIMLGTVDEGHIIRTIEYWDIEQRRDKAGSYEHKAVIVAEEITNRFFNVIGLLNKVVPMIAVKLSAFRVDSKLCLDFVRVLDLTEEREDESSEPVSRKDWEDWAARESMQIMDKTISLIPRETGQVRVKYNQDYVVVATTGTNFCWFYPRKSPRIRMEIWLGEDRDAFVKKLREKGVDVSPSYAESIGIRLTAQDLEKHQATLKEVLATSEQRSR